MNERRRTRDIVVFLFVLVVATSAVAQPEDPPSLWVWDWEKFEVSLFHPGCLGECSVYEVTIDGDGSARYDGHEHVSVEGERTVVLDKAQLESIVLQIFESGFWNTEAETRRYEVTFINNGVMARRVGEQVTLDSEELIVRIRMGEIEKSIWLRSADHPESKLWELTRQIEEIVGTSRWVQGETVP